MDRATIGVGLIGNQNTAMNPKAKKKCPGLRPPSSCTPIADKRGADDGTIQALVLLAGWCGLRFREVSEPEPQGFRRRLQDRHHSASRDAPAEDGSRCRTDAMKTSEARTVTIPPHIREHIRLAWRNTDALLFVPARGGCHLNDRVFDKSIFQKVSRRCWTRGLFGQRPAPVRWRKERSGLPRWSPVSRISRWASHHSSAFDRCPRTYGNASGPPLQHSSDRGPPVTSRDVHQIPGEGEKAATELHDWYPKRYQKHCHAQHQAD